jgi:hypothetical protein
LRKEKKEHPHLGATYEIMEKDLTFAVQVRIPGVLPTTISSFSTRGEAERWIERHKAGVAQGLPQRTRFNSRPKG